jgi:hypothetical protein
MALFLRQGFVQIRIEGLPECVNGFDSGICQEILKLFVDHAEAIDDRSGFWRVAGSLQAKLEIIQDWNEPLQKAGIRILD